MSESPLLPPDAGEALHPRVRLVWAVGALSVTAAVLLVGWLLERIVVARTPFDPTARPGCASATTT